MDATTRKRDVQRPTTSTHADGAMRRQFQLLGVLAAVGLLLFGGNRLAHAATFTVTSTADTVDTNPGNSVCADAVGNCTLRAAIMEANALPGADTITLPAGTYTLTIPGAFEDAGATGDLDITGDLTINGAGAVSTIIMRQFSNPDRVLHILAGTVTISGVTITGANNGFVGGGGGGGISNAGALTLNSSVVSGNFSSGGGDGGGILNKIGATATLNSSTVSGNSLGAFRFGGGIANEGTLTLNSSTVSGNNSTGSGGGLSNAATLTLNNSTVSGNSAGCGGGGIENIGGTLTLNSSTVSSNSATGGSCGGGGIRMFGGSTTLSNTIVANSASGGNCFVAVGTLTSNGFNLSSDATCAFAGPGDLNSTNPVLGPLANNGGPTETHALLPGSPAIDAVPLGFCTVSTDQRGVPRPQGAACDIGAYETSACAPPPSGMVAWWPLDEVSGATSFQDIIGGNNATPFASPLGAAQAPQPVSGGVNGAIHFPKFGNGLSGARVGPQGALATIGSADFTIDAWVEFPSAPANRLHYIVNKFDTVQNKGYALYVISPGIASNERLEFKWGDGTNVSTVQTISPVTPGQFHHVAVTFARNVGPNALDIRLYVDGTQQGQQVGNPPGFSSLVNFVFLEIGQQPGTIDEPITIDELEIFNVALSLSDIQSIYNAGSAGKCKCTTGGQSVDLTLASTGTVFGVGSGVAATVSNPLTINFSVLGCSGQEMFLVVNVPVLGIPFSYLNSSNVLVPLPNPPSLIAPWQTGGPLTSNGTHTLFSGSLPLGTYDLYLICDTLVNGHLDLILGPPLCIRGAFDYLPLTVQ